MEEGVCINEGRTHDLLCSRGRCKMTSLGKADFRLEAVIMRGLRTRKKG